LLGSKFASRKFESLLGLKFRDPDFFNWEIDEILEVFERGLLLLLDEFVELD